MITQDQLQKLIENLEGCYTTLEDECNALGFKSKDLTIEQEEEIDNQLFRCIHCGYWHTNEFRADLFSCKDCIDVCPECGYDVDDCVCNDECDCWDDEDNSDIENCYEEDCSDCDNYFRCHGDY